MRTHYTYKIEILTGNRWQVTDVERKPFSRDPRSVARQLLEQWIIRQQGDLPGGRVVVVNGGSNGVRGIVPIVRVMVYRSGPSGELGPLAAVACLGHTARDHEAA